MTSISIALATYNGERFLREQFDSLSNQSRLPDELVIADDGSTDRTLQIVGEFAARAPFKTVILPEQGRLGYRANFMRCAERCTGEFIAFCDQDDIWDAEKLEVAIGAADASTLLIQHDFRVGDAEGRPLPGNLDMLGISDGRRWATVLGLTQIFRRDLLRYWQFWDLSVDHNHPTERMAHDQWVYFLASLFGRVKVVRQALLTYRQHGGNTCGLEHQGLSQHKLRPAHVLREALSGRFESRSMKRDLIAKGLGQFRLAAKSRAAIISDILASCDVGERRASLTAEKADYELMAAYSASRLGTYESGSVPALMSAVMSAKTAYLFNGSRGLKDLLLDVALNA